MSEASENLLNQLVELEKSASKFGFEWPNQQAIIEQAISECEEIREAIEHNEPEHRVQEEIGDLLHTAISLCRFSGFDLEQTLTQVVIKFGSRMEALKAVAKEKGLDSLEGQSTKFMLELWDEVKKREKNN